MINVGLLAYGEMGPFALKSLLKSYKIDWIITPPDTLNNLPVEILAEKNSIKIIRTNSEEDILKAIKKTTPKIVIISSYNKILSPKILKLTRFLNVHHGDLPRYRGRANLNWAIINGRKEVGISFHQVIPDLDAGKIYRQYIIKIGKKETIKSLYNKVNKIVEKDLVTTVEEVLQGYPGKSQQGEATYCCTRLPQDGYIDWQLTTEEIDRLIRALTKPFPGAFTYYKSHKMTVWTAEIPKSPRIYEGSIPGRIALIHKGLGVEVLTGNSSIIIKKIEFQGKNYNASDLIKSVKHSLGINIADLYEKLILQANN